MKKIFFIIILLFSTQCFSQNTYYDAIDLMKWFRLKDTSKDQATTAARILGKLLKYSEGGSKQPFLSDKNLFIGKVYVRADSIYSFQARYRIPKDTVIRTVLRTTNIPDTNLSRLKNKFITDSIRERNFSDLARDYFLKLNTIETTVRTTSPFKTNLFSILDSLYNEFNVDKSKYDTIYAAIVQNDTTEVNIRMQIESYIKERQKRNEVAKADDKEDIYNAVMALDTQTILKVLPMLKLPVEGLFRSEKDKDMLISEELYRNADKVKDGESAVSQSMSDLNFPTQSEIIDAIAIYLARRVKQEATLAFIEGLNRALKSDELARDLFPETWQIMQSEDAYSSPRFGVKWRNAIASDYISLPQNILHSKYIAARIHDKIMKQYFNDAVVFGSYVAKKYNFIDIIRTLFNEPDKLQGKWTRTGVDVLHILNTEFYDTSSRRFWISPENFIDRDTAELYCMYDLLRIRYEKRISGEIDFFKKAELIKSRVNSIQNFYTELLTVLQQFYVVQSAAAGRKGEGAVKDGFWDSQRTLIGFLLDQQLFPLEPRVRNALTVCQKGFYVYDYISNKNYVAAADNVMQIIQELTNQSPKLLINLSDKQMISLKSDVKNTELVKRLVASNETFENILLVRSLRDTLSSFLQEDISADTLTISRQFVADRFVFYTGKVKVFDLLFPRNTPSIKLKDLLSMIKQFDEAQMKEIQTTYKKLVDDVKDVVTDLKTNRFLYRNAKALTDDMLQAGHIFIKKENSNYFKWLTDFSGLLTEIATSKNSKELANVIEAYAKPAGSYRLKRNSGFSFDINAFVGIYGGQEKIKGSDEYKWVYGLTAPIGLAVSLGTRVKKYEEPKDPRRLFISKKGELKYRTQHSFTLDFPIIDIGAVVSYRLTEGEDKGLPKDVRWSQVISPGINLRWGIKGTPLCLGIGVQRSPELRSFNNETRDATRFHVSFAFDLPLFNIYHSGY